MDVKRVSHREPLLIGEANQASGRGAFDGRPGRLLAGLLGATAEWFLHRVEAVNLLDRPQAKQPRGKGRVFDAVAARRAASKLDLRGRAVVLAGKRVALAFGLRNPAWLSPVALGRGELVAFVTPHPSGIVQFWNGDENRRAVKKLLRKLLRCANKNPRTKGVRGRGSR